MNKDQLRRFAAMAYNNLWTRGVGIVRPQPGLEIVLSHVDDVITLKAIQEDTPIHDDDAPVIADAFTVPPNAEPVRKTRQTTNQVSGRAVTQHSLTWMWREVAAG